MSQQFNFSDQILIETPKSIDEIDQCNARIKKMLCETYDLGKGELTKAVMCFKKTGNDEIDYEKTVELDKKTLQDKELDKKVVEKIGEDIEVILKKIYCMIEIDYLKGKYLDAKSKTIKENTDDEDDAGSEDEIKSEGDKKDDKHVGQFEEKEEGNKKTEKIEKKLNKKYPTDINAFNNILSIEKHSKKPEVNEKKDDKKNETSKEKNNDEEDEFSLKSLDEKIRKLNEKLVDLDKKDDKKRTEIVEKIISRKGKCDKLIKEIYGEKDKNKVFIIYIIYNDEKQKLQCSKEELNKLPTITLDQYSKAIQGVREKFKVIMEIEKEREKYTYFTCEEYSSTLSVEEFNGIISLEKERIIFNTVTKVELENRLTAIKEANKKAEKIVYLPSYDAAVVEKAVNKKHEEINEGKPKNIDNNSNINLKNSNETVEEINKNSEIKVEEKKDEKNTVEEKKKEDKIIVEKKEDKNVSVLKELPEYLDKTQDNFDKVYLSTKRICKKVTFWFNAKYKPEQPSIFNGFNPYSMYQNKEKYPLFNEDKSYRNSIKDRREHAKNEKHKKTKTFLGNNYVPESEDKNNKHI